MREHEYLGGILVA